MTEKMIVIKPSEQEWEQLQELLERDPVIKPRLRDALAARTVWSDDND